MRNYREEIETALRGGISDVVPLTIYTDLVPEGIDLSPLQEKGLSFAARRDVYRRQMRDVTVEEARDVNGRLEIVYRTPVGTLSEIWQRSGYGASHSLRDTKA